MGKLGQAQEPSMEEILASIRRIISDDDQKTAAAQAGPKLAVVETVRSEASPPAPAPPAAAVKSSEPHPVKPPEPVQAETHAPEPEILELSEADAALTDDDLDDSDVAFAEPVRAPEPVAPARPAPPPAGVSAVTAEGGHDRRLLSQRSDEAVNSAFNQLAATFLTNQARTLEDIVKEMMRPMLKSWLDDNLPPLVERLVRDEIERVSRGRR